MKRLYILLFAIIILAGSFSSCKKFLEEENRSNVTADEYYRTAAGYESLVNANYSQLREIYGGDPWLYSAGTDLYAQGREEAPPGLATYTELTPSTEGVDQIYTDCYVAIQVANQALFYADLTEVTSSLENRIGEVKFLRAHAYFLLVQTYGGVPLVEDYLDAPVLQYERASAEEIYEFIVTEMKDALNMVSDGAYMGRVNERAVKHFLAKVYLTRGYESFGPSDDFSQAAMLFDDVINGEGLSLSFEEVFTPGNEQNSEILFSVQYSAGSVATDPGELGNMQSQFFAPYQGGSEIAGDAPFRSYSLCPTDYALGLFTEKDERWKGTFMVTCYNRYYDYYDVDDHSELGVFHYYAPQWSSSEQDSIDFVAENPDAFYHSWGTYSSRIVSLDYETIPCKKFDDPTAPFSEDGSSTKDIFLARLADTYLLAAEAYLQSGDAGTGLIRLNVVRQRAKVDNATAGDFDLEYILDERARELLGEYHRWFDLKRTGTLVERASKYSWVIESSNFNGANGELKILRPIPQEAIDLNQNPNFKQNPAYN